MPKHNWDKKTISTYITQQQKEVWENTAISECKRVADFVRDRVESTLNNKDLNGKQCLWLEIPKELYEKAQTEYKDVNKKNPLEDLIQYHIRRIIKEDTDNELLWEQSASNPDIDSLKAKNVELERQIELLNAEIHNLRSKGTGIGSNEIFRVLDKEKFLSLEQIAVQLNRGDDIDTIHELYDEVEETMFKVGMIEYNGRGYRLNLDIEPVERVHGGKEIKVEV